MSINSQLQLQKTVRIKKYEFTGKIEVYYGNVLHRIRALIDIPLHNVKAGDLGGWVQWEDNLSNDPNDSSWVANEGRVYGNTIVSENALVDNATVCCRSRVSGNAIISEWSTVTGYSVITDNARITGESVIDDSNISGEAFVDNKAEINDSIIADNCHIDGNTEINECELRGNVHVLESVKKMTEVKASSHETFWSTEYTSNDNLTTIEVTNVSQSWYYISPIRINKNWATINLSTQEVFYNNKTFKSKEEFIEYVTSNTILKKRELNKQLKLINAAFEVSN